MNKLGIALIALLVGGLIYILWRSETLMMFVWFEHIGLNNVFGSMRNSTSGVSVSLPNWFLFSLPNALWLFSGLLVFDFIWGSKLSASKLFWLSFFWMVAVGAEVSQALDILPGTFDWQDMSFMILAGFSALLFMSPSIQEERKLKT